MPGMRAQLEARWSKLSPKKRVLTVTAVAIALGSLLAIAYPGRTTCATRMEAEAYLGDMMEGLQRQAADGTLSVQALAGRVKQINDAATRFTADSNAKAYCRALDAIAGGRDP
jgi:hypothetical protein